MKSLLRILLIEDPLHDGADIFETLKAGEVWFESRTLYQLSDFKSCLSEFSPHLIIAYCKDFNCAGHQALSIVQQSKNNTGFICITEAEYETETLALMKAGADDYILRSNLLRLPFAIRNRIAKLRSDEEKMEQTKALLSEAQDLAQIGNWNYDLVSDKLSWSDGLKKIYWGDKNLVPRNEYFDNLIHPEDKERALQEIEVLLKLGKNMKTNFRIINPKGEVKILEGENRVELNEEGVPIRLYGVLQDVTAVKLAEITLRKSKANLRTLLNHTDAAYILVDHHFNIVSHSQMAKEIAEFQGHSEELDGTSIFNYFEVTKHDKLQRIIDDVIQGKNISYETNHIEKDGSEKWYALKWIGVNDIERKNWGFILSVKDVTQQKMAMKERNRMNTELLNRNKNLEQFTYVVSHNLRAPVANIIGLSDLLYEMCPKDNHAAELVKGLTKSVRSLDTVIKDLNYILQFKESSLSKNMEWIDFENIIEDVRMSINHMIVREKVTFEYHIAENQVHTVRSHLHSILYNLILNSIKYRLPDVSPRLVIRTHLLSEQIVMVIEDNGRGIDLKKYGTQIFGLYKRFDLEVEGKGMGLFMVKNQVEELGGSIEVTSTPGMGTTFSIVLPHPPLSN